MLVILDKLKIGKLQCISVEGDISFLKNGIKLHDENGNIFEVETVAMTHYKNINNYKRHAELVLRGDVETIGKILFINQSN